ncbi:hypothetical protein OGM63_15835 [Plectonema radiosum NIES-515]|uniref:Uncharacterized protein n=1 Tax=Plectonema radiosum NIES-515 TaxID=2986073 RepID=A0ABT3B0R3_9CYAN|nr:hypothetical protein [Plectonema radiosum]MCV3214966.1 hypothetical protein [Plectonema radiosum NIES-515]
MLSINRFGRFSAQIVKVRSPFRSLKFLLCVGAIKKYSDRQLM